MSAKAVNTRVCRTGLIQAVAGHRSLLDVLFILSFVKPVPLNEFADRWEIRLANDFSLALLQCCIHIEFELGSLTLPMVDNFIFTVRDI